MASQHAVSSTEPADVLDPDEPRTPGWMPLLGLTLFVVGGIALAKYGPTQQTFTKPQTELSAGAAPSAAPTPGGPNMPPGGALPPNPAGRPPMPQQQGGAPMPPQQGG